MRLTEADHRTIQGAAVIGTNSEIAEVSDDSPAASRSLPRSVADWMLEHPVAATALLGLGFVGMQMWWIARA
ncbi:MAG: hypothetical protein ACKOYM_03470, partial [Actinomycetes bacterium]